MPRISEFFGIYIYMYWFDNKRHKKPHFHARYSGMYAVFDFNGNCIQGDIGKRASRLVAEWAVERQEELSSAWDISMQGKEIPWITPLQ
jgi:hypothetical protein